MAYPRTPYLPIPGTWAWDGQDTPDEWWKRGSVFHAAMRGEGLRQIGNERPFWSTALDGVNPIDKWLQRGEGLHRVWRFGGDNLAEYLAGLPLTSRRLIVHSHGLQVALYAVAVYKRPIARLVSVGSPVRADMQAIATAARPHIGQWMHLASDHSDTMQWLGELLDGKVGIVREHPLADRNEHVTKAGHSGVLEEPALVYQMAPMIAAFLKEAA